MSDNTSTMSGEGATGGCFKQVREFLNYQVKGAMPRVPCVFHVVHLGYTNVRAILLGGYTADGQPTPIPGPKQRDIIHLWNFLFDVYSEFGHDSVDFPEMKDALWDELKVLLTKTWKPVSTRWLYEHYAVGWLLENWDSVVFCCQLAGKARQ